MIMNRNTVAKVAREKGDYVLSVLSIPGATSDRSFFPRDLRLSPDEFDALFAAMLDFRTVEVVQDLRAADLEQIYTNNLAKIREAREKAAKATRETAAIRDLQAKAGLPVDPEQTPVQPDAVPSDFPEEEFFPCMVLLSRRYLEDSARVRRFPLAKKVMKGGVA